MGPTPAAPVSIPLRHAGRERPYLLVAPQATSGPPIPLVVELHGRGIDALRFDWWTGFGELASEAGFALALPNAIDEIWNDGRAISNLRERPDDVAYLGAVIDDVISRLTIDRRRVFVVGMSNGAAMAGRLACEQARRFAAVAQVAGTAAASIAAACQPSGPLPILQIHGTSDRFAPYTGGRARALPRLLLRLSASPSISVDDWARMWVERNGASSGPVVSTIPPDTTVRRWSGATPAADVVFYRVEGGGHTWPGIRQWSPPHLGRVTRGLDATRVIWDFFAAHPQATNSTLALDR